MAGARSRTSLPVKAGEDVSGMLIGSANPVSGRYAMIDNGLGFSLVPSQQVLDRRIGKHIAGCEAGIESNGS